MKNKGELNNRIIKSVFEYETKRITSDVLIKLILFFAIVVVTLVFGGVIFDIFIENGLIDLFVNFSSIHFVELGSVLMYEIPQWLLFVYLVSLILGCILIGIVIKNRKLIYHKIKSIITYWFTL